MKSGQLQHLVMLQKPTEVRGTQGGLTESWEDKEQAFAAILPLRGKEWHDAQQINDTLSVKIRLHYRTDIRADWRIIHGADIYQVDAPPINVAGQNHTTEVLCKQIT